MSTVHLVAIPETPLRREFAHLDPVKRPLARNYFIVREAFQQRGDAGSRMTSDPSAADVILVFPILNNHFDILAFFENETIRKFSSKCVMFNTADDALRVLPGFYTAIRRGSVDERIYRGGFYPFVIDREPAAALSVNGSFSYLYSFLGAFDTHPVRYAVGALPHRRALIVDTSESAARRRGNSPAVYRDYQAQYKNSLLKSKFILCPAGGCPSTIRIFETMKAGRVPVIIADEWVPPPNIPWQDFCLFIREKDVHTLPEMLEATEHRFEPMASASRKAWDVFLSPARMPDTLTRWGLDLLNDMNENNLRRVHYADLLKQTATWTFARRGLLPRLKQALNRVSIS